VGVCVNRIGMEQWSAARDAIKAQNEKDRAAREV